MLEREHKCSCVYVYGSFPRCKKEQTLPVNLIFFYLLLAAVELFHLPDSTLHCVCLTRTSPRRRREKWRMPSTNQSSCAAFLRKSSLSTCPAALRTNGSLNLWVLLRFSNKGTEIYSSWISAWSTCCLFNSWRFNHVIVVSSHRWGRFQCTSHNSNNNEKFVTGDQRRLLKHWRNTMLDLV